MSYSDGIGRQSGKGLFCCIFQDIWGSSGLSFCDIVCERSPINRYDYSLMRKPVNVTMIMCIIHSQTRQFSCTLAIVRLYVWGNAGTR